MANREQPTFPEEDALADFADHLGVYLLLLRVIMGGAAASEVMGGEKLLKF